MSVGSLPDGQAKVSVTGAMNCETGLPEGSTAARSKSWPATTSPSGGGAGDVPSAVSVTVSPLTPGGIAPGGKLTSMLSPDGEVPEMMPPSESTVPVATTVAPVAVLTGVTVGGGGVLVVVEVFVGATAVSVSVDVGVLVVVEVGVSVG